MCVLCGEFCLAAGLTSLSGYLLQVATRMQLESEKNLKSAAMGSSSNSEKLPGKTSYKKIPKLLTGKLLNCSSKKPVLAEDDIEFLVKNTAISRDQVNTQFKIFLKNHPDGQISRKSFQSMMKACYPGADTEKLSKHIWRMYDANQDGHIDFREFMVVLYIMSSGTPEENLRQIFKVFDINNDGKINIGEMKKIVHDLSKLMDEKDTEKDSKDNLVQSAFSEMDEDGDGEITQEEFIKACLSQKKFSTMLTLKIIDIFITK